MLINKDTTLEEAKRIVSNAVYQSAIVFEALEMAGIVRGNGHHMAQQIAETAANLVTERWTGRPPTTRGDEEGGEGS